MAAEITYPEGQWPEVVIVMTTWAGPPERNMASARLGNTERAIASLRRYLHYPNLSWHIADDGSPPEYQEKIKALFGKDKYTFTDTNRGWDINNNLNLGIKAALERADVFATWADDRFLHRDVSLKQYVSLLMSYEDVGAIRFKPYNPGLRATPVQRCGATWWVIDKTSPVRHAIHLGLNFYHRRYWETYGFLTPRLWPPDVAEADTNTRFVTTPGPEQLIHNDFWHFTEMPWGLPSTWEARQNAGYAYRQHAPWEDDLDLQYQTHCRLCGGSQLITFLDFGNMPLAGGFLSAEEFAGEKTYPLEAVVCGNCHLVQTSAVINPDVLFRHYFYLSSTTETLRAHFKGLAILLREQLLPKDDPFVVEIGCNDGVLLKPLREMGVRALGVDPARNIAEMAQEHGLMVIPEYFTSTLARKIAQSEGHPDAITTSNCFAHIDDIGDVMGGIQELLAPDGTLIVEVGYIADMIEQVQYDAFYHEHLSYFSVHTLDALFHQHGFEVVLAERMPMHQGTVRVFGRRIGQQRPQIDSILAYENERGITSNQAYINYAQRVLQHRRDLLKCITDRQAEGRTLCGYGAAGRATILLNFCGIDTKYVQYIVDASPLRAGKCMPGVHIPIYPPSHFAEHPTDDCLITAWTYEREIVAKEPGYEGTFIIPLPEVRLVRKA